MAQHDLLTDCHPAWWWVWKIHALKNRSTRRCCVFQFTLCVSETRKKICELTVCSWGARVSDHSESSKPSQWTLHAFCCVEFVVPWFGGGIFELIAVHVVVVVVLLLVRACPGTTGIMVISSWWEPAMLTLHRKAGVSLVTSTQWGKKWCSPT